MKYKSGDIVRVKKVRMIGDTPHTLEGVGIILKADNELSVYRVMVAGDTIYNFMREADLVEKYE